ncbi:MAG: HAMP domain-containing protein, partial [Verrucomicrobia bacterium]|nr:HAMP domain-containing protein [Verrucomicrobiota bacterium]
MRNTVGTKISVGLAVALLILAIIGGVTYRTTSQSIENARWVELTLQVDARLEALHGDLTEVEASQRGYLLTGLSRYLEPYEATVLQIDNHLTVLRSLTADNPNQQRRLTTLDPIIKERLARLTEGVTLRKDKGLEAVVQFVTTGTGKNLMDQIRTVINDMKEEQNTLLDKRTKQSTASARQAIALVAVGVPSLIVVLAVGGLFFARHISTPLRQIAATADRMAAGELPGQIAANDRGDEVGVLERAFERMARFHRDMIGVARQIAAGDLGVEVKPQSDKDELGNALAAMVRNLRALNADIREAASVLEAAAAQIVTSTSQTAAGAREAATAVSETTTTVEEIRQTAQVSSQKARAVADGAQKTAQTSQAGKKSTDDTVQGMNRIKQQMDSIAESMVRLSEQTQAISDIITSVDDLAQQSNLLAVNAAIEAAKAGEQGKGFAVVAQEVKSLADQSKQATAQVRTILNDIQKATGTAVMATEQGAKAVEAGVRQSGQAGESILALATSVTEAAQAATQIAASSQQQLIGMDQVAAAMESIKTASVQNVESARQLEAAARNVNELGQRL